MKMFKNIFNFKIEFFLCKITVIFIIQKIKILSKQFDHRLLTELTT